LFFLVEIQMLCWSLYIFTSSLRLVSHCI